MRSTLIPLAFLLATVAHTAFAETNETLLLVDDRYVLYRAGTERFLQSPTRHEANPIIAETKPWEVAIAWTSVYYDPETKRYQLWYQAYGGSNSPQLQCVTCYAESKDGIRWTKPDLGLFP